jgi:molybdopterin converting factor small subunit
VATVFIPSGLRHLTRGAEELCVEARTVRELIAALDLRFPGIGERLRAGVAVAIDGEIIQDPLLEPVEPESEVHFLPSISGG